MQLDSLVAGAHLALDAPEAALAGLDALPASDGGPDADEARRHWVRVRVDMDPTAAVSNEALVGRPAFQVLVDRAPNAAVLADPWLGS